MAHLGLRAFWVQFVTCYTSATFGCSSVCGGERVNNPFWVEMPILGVFVAVKVWLWPVCVAGTGWTCTSNQKVAPLYQKKCISVFFCPLLLQMAFFSFFIFWSPKWVHFKKKVVKSNMKKEKKAIWSKRGQKKTVMHFFWYKRATFWLLVI